MPISEQVSRLPLLFSSFFRKEEAQSFPTSAEGHARRTVNEVALLQNGDEAPNRYILF